MAGQRHRQSRGIDPNQGEWGEGWNRNLRELRSLGPAWQYFRQFA